MKRTTSVEWRSSTEGAPWKEKRVKSSTGRGAGLAVSRERFQTWMGMGGCFNEMGWAALTALDEADRRAVIEELFDRGRGCRFNLCRIPIGASDYALEWHSLNPHDGDFEMKRFSIARDREKLVPYIRMAQKVNGDISFFASPWSPPIWLKHPRAYSNGSPRREKEYQDALALYYVKFVKAYAREGIPVGQIHIMNEPASTHHKFPMCEWTGAAMRDFIRDHLGPLFEKTGTKSEIWFSTLNTSDYNGYVNAAMSDARARKYIAGIGLQWDGRHMVRRVHDAWPEVPLMQTENECGDGENSWRYAQYVFDLMYDYIAGGVSAYIYWNMVLPEGGQSTWGWKQNSMITVDMKRRKAKLQPEFYLMKHLSAFVAPGAVRVGLEGQWAGTSIGFENPDGATVLVVNNPFDGPRKCAVRTAGGGFTAQLPANSFNTFRIDAET